MQVESIVFCAPSPLQRNICRQMFGNVEYRKAMEGGSGQVVLSLIAKISKVVPSLNPAAFLTVLVFLSSNLAHLIPHSSLRLDCSLLDDLFPTS
jgi:hypothetical protein